MTTLMRKALTAFFLTATMQPAIAAIIGSHDMANATEATGWTCETGNFGQTLSVHLYKENGVFIGVTIADINREQAVGDACGGNPARGFDYLFPSSIKDGQAHWIYAYGVNDITGIGTLLGGSPIRVTFPVGPMASPTCTSSAPEAPSTTQTSGGFDLYAYGVQNATAVWFPTWADPGQGDIVWYPGVNLGAGTWKATVDLGRHFDANPIDGTFHVHVYPFNPDYHYQFCSDFMFTRSQAPIALSAGFEFQSVPTTMIAGRTYPVEIVMRNTGSTAWTSQQSFRLRAQNSPWGLNWVELAHSVGPNQTVVFAFNVTAPTRRGNYQFQWRMAQGAAGQFFGENTAALSISVISETAKQTLFNQATANEAAITPQVAGPPEPFVVQINDLGPSAAATALTWDLAPYTGFTTASPFSSYQRGPQDVVGSTGAQSQDGTVGMWLDTAMTPPLPHIGLLNISLGYAFAPNSNFYPWSNPANTLSTVYDLNVFRAVTAPGKETYFGFNYTFIDARSHRTIYFGAIAFDPRGVQETVMYDGCEGCSGNPIIGASYDNGTMFAHRTTPYVDPRFVTQRFSSYGMQVTKTEFERGLAGANALIQSTCVQQALSDMECRKKKVSPYGGDYKLVAINFGGEVNFEGGPGGQLGGSLKSLRVTID